MKNVQDIYPATPMQETMLLHALTRGVDDTLFNQFYYSYEAPLDVNRLVVAWEKLVARHAALRTAFVWEGVRVPQQVVRQQVKLPISIEDWREQSEDKQQSMMQQLLVEDRQEVFKLNRAPLMRVALRRIKDNHWLLLWSSHHLVLDRWCLATLFVELDYFYSSQRLGVNPSGAEQTGAALEGAAEVLPAAPSFRDYVDWVQRQDKQEALQYWREHLVGLQHATLLAPAAQSTKHWMLPTTTADVPGHEVGQPASVRLKSKNFELLQRYAKFHGVTVGAVVQGAWALLLYCVTQQQDVVFGAAVSGRPNNLHQVDAMVGSFVNKVPLRLRLRPNRDLVDIFRDVQQAQLSRNPYEYVSPAQMMSCTPLVDRSKSSSLYDSLVVWLASSSEPCLGEFSLQARNANYSTSYPLTLSIEEHVEGLNFLLSGNKIDSDYLVPLLARFYTIITQVVALGADAKVGDVLDLEQGTSPVSGELAALAKQDFSPVVEPVRLADKELLSGRESLPVEVMLEFLSSRWAEVLDIGQIAPDNDFFELGGTSLQAAMLHRHIESALRRSVPLLSLFKSSTLSGMAHTLVHEDWPLHANILTMLQSSERPGALFCVASPEVSTLGYFLLSRYLPQEQAMYVVQSPPSDGSLSVMHPSEVRHYAEKYLTAMQQVEPNGPLNILTMCGGSHISIEIARLATARKQGIAFLGVINTWAMYTVSRKYYVSRFKNIMRYYWQRLLQTLPLPRYLPQSSATTLNVATTPPIGGGLQEEDVGISNPWISEVGFERCDPKLQKITVPITVFRIESQQPWRIRDYGLGWSKHAAPVEVVKLDGDDHNAILREPGVKQFAEKLQQLLASAAKDVNDGSLR